MVRKEPELPQDVKAEADVLGSLQLAGEDGTPEAMARVADILDSPDYFTLPAYRDWYAVALDLYQDGKPVDLTTWEGALRGRDLLERYGGIGEFTRLANNVPTYLNVEAYARSVKECAIRRRIIKEATDVVALAYKPPAGVQAYEVLTKARQRFDLIDTTGVDGAVSTIPGVMMNDVKRKPIHWFWTGRLARGKLHVIDGDPGLGKGLMTIDLAARVTRGDMMPVTSERVSPGNVILITPEDDPADTIGPRLEAAGADLERVRFLSTVPTTDPKTRQTSERLLTIPRDVPLIEAAISCDQATLVIVDPVMSVLDAGVNTARDNEVRDALMPFKQMIERTGACGIFVRHLNKTGGEKAIYRGGGSIGIGALARAVYLLGEHPDGGDGRVLACSKFNIGRKPSSLTFTVVEACGMARIEWSAQECAYDADSLLSARKSQERRDTVRVLQEADEPLSPAEVAAALSIGPEDDSGQANIRKRLTRMAKAGEIASTTYGKYTVKSKTLSQQSQQSQSPDPLPAESVTSVTGCGNGQHVYAKLRTADGRRVCIECDTPEDGRVPA